MLVPRSRYAAFRARSWTSDAIQHSHLRLQSARTFSHQNEERAFEWARRHPSEARLCLEVPPIDISKSSTEPLQNLKEYCVSGTGGSCRTAAIVKNVTVRNVLSATCCRRRLLWRTLLAKWKILKHSVASVQEQKQLSLWTVGESYLCTGLRVAKHKMSALIFVGPHVPKMKPNVQKITLNNTSTLQITWHLPGFLHDVHGGLSEYDAFILFNPGFGHRHLKDGWRPTLELLRELGKPLICTVHSKLDAQRDTEELEKYFSAKVEYTVNPFASQVSFHDPLENIRVSPNQYVAVINP